MVVNPHIKFSYEDYKNMPESETTRYELIEGELYMVPSPSFEHQHTSGGLYRALADFVEEHGLGTVLAAPLDVVLKGKRRESVVQPDIMFISKARSKIIHHEEIRGGPDLIVEILSPSTGKRDRTAKKMLYARHGVTEYWLVEPESETIEVLKLTARGYRLVATYSKKETLRSPLLPGLEISLQKIF